jgi:hypothetical protein
MRGRVFRVRERRGEGGTFTSSVDHAVYETAHGVELLVRLEEKVWKFPV